MTPSIPLSRFIELRRTLEPWFSADTRLGITADGAPPSTGHCACVAAILYFQLDARMASATVHGQSHWFGRVRISPDEVVDVDLTGDQFGFADVQMKQNGELYPGSRIRPLADLNTETMERARRLAERAGLAKAARGLSSELAARARSILEVPEIAAAP